MLGRPPPGPTRPNPGPRCWRSFLRSPICHRCSVHRPVPLLLCSQISRRPAAAIEGASRVFSPSTSKPDPAKKVAGAAPKSPGCPKDSPVSTSCSCKRTPMGSTPTFGASAGRPCSVAQALRSGANDTAPPSASRTTSRPRSRAQRSPPHWLTSRGSLLVGRQRAKGKGSHFIGSRFAWYPCGLMRLDDYEDLEQIGAGTFGVTYRARDRESGDLVALKMLAVRDLEGWKPLERFEREAKVLRSLKQKHPGVVRFIDAFEADEEESPKFFIVSEFVEGPTLAELIAKGHRWDESVVTQLLESLLETLEYLHGLSPQVVHRDIKPGNIVMKDGDRPVLIDFGSVVDVMPEHRGELTIAGTAGYMAPEQAMGMIDPRSDLFGVGATILHALTHTHPSEFPRKDLEFDLDTGLSCAVAIRSVLERLLESNPSQRFQTASEALAALRGEAPHSSSNSLQTQKKQAMAKILAPPREVTPKIKSALTIVRAISALGPSRTVVFGLLTFVASMLAMNLLPGPLGTPLGLVTLMVLLLGGSLWAR
ncbi:MAG TPA: hypothetical protein ENK31_03020, partial [Nannocystis exedens]|nr:hypothetical protein [Nannocystis exedens]